MARWVDQLLASDISSTDRKTVTRLSQMMELVVDDSDRSNKGRLSANTTINDRGDRAEVIAAFDPDSRDRPLFVIRVEEEKSGTISKWYANVISSFLVGVELLASCGPFDPNDMNKQDADAS